MNKPTKKAGLSFDANKFKKRINEYYETFGQDKPRFAGGAGSYVFATSVVEQLFTDIIERVAKSFDDNADEDESDKLITRKRIKNVINADKELKYAFNQLLCEYDSKDDYPNSQFLTGKKLEIWIDKVLEKGIIFSAPSAILYRYLINAFVDRCVQYTAIIKKSSKTKSIKLQECENACRLLLGEKLFKKYNNKAQKAAELATEKDDSDSDDEESSASSEGSKKKSKGKKKSSKKKKGTDDDDDGSDGDDEPKSKKKSKKTSKKKSSKGKKKSTDDNE